MDGSDIHDAACRLERIALTKAKQIHPSIDISVRSKYYHIEPLLCALILPS